MLNVPLHALLVNFIDMQINHIIKSTNNNSIHNTIIIRTLNVKLKFMMIHILIFTRSPCA